VTAPAVAFERERARLTGLAYRMTGSHHDADDIVQEAWLRFARHQETVEIPAAWLTTAVTRLSIDRIRRVASDRARYVGPWLPEPASLELGPDEVVDTANSLTLAFLIMLDRLSPLERAAFVLVDVFGERYTQVSTTLGRSEAACRQLVHRARSRMRSARESEFEPIDGDRLRRLVVALVEDDPDALVALLSPDVVLVSDGGPTQHAARRPVVGRDRVIRFLVNLTRRNAGAIVTEGTVNHAACLFVTSPERTVVVTADVLGDSIASFILLLNPAKIEGVAEPRRMR
jgi:RNA polymerase sigma-70 factor (ECF subfamily)